MPLRQKPIQTLHQWIRLVWPDLLFMFLIGPLMICLHKQHTSPWQRLFLYDPERSEGIQHALPAEPFIVPIWLSALFGFGVPIPIIFICSFFPRTPTRSRFWEFHNAIFGLVYAAFLAQVFSVVMKWVIAEQRPNFFAKCDPDPSREEGQGPWHRYHTTAICRNPSEAYKTDSSPSGHATEAFVCYTYLSLYLHAKLRPLERRTGSARNRPYHVSIIHLAMISLPILGATVISSTLDLDDHHHWWDLVGGALIGSAMACFCFQWIKPAIGSARRSDDLRDAERGDDGGAFIEAGRGKEAMA